MQTAKVSRQAPAAGLSVLVVSADERRASRVCRIVRRDRRLRLLGWVGSKHALVLGPQEPDVALVDLLLPGLDVPDSIAEYKRRHPGCIVAAWSDLDLPYLRSVGLATGADAYLVVGPAGQGLTDFLRCALGAPTVVVGGGDL